MLHGLHHFHAVHVWHLEVREDEVVVATLNQSQGLGAVLDRIHTESLQHQDAAEGIEDHGLVVHGQDPGLGIGHFHALQALGLVGEVQFDRGVEHRFASLAFPVFPPPAQGRAHQEVHADESHEHEEDQNGGHVDLLSEGCKGWGRAAFWCRNCR